MSREFVQLKCICSIGYIPGGLSKVIAPVLEKQIILTTEADLTAYPRHAPEGRCMLGGGIKVQCMYTFYGPKENKTKFINKLKRSL